MAPQDLTTESGVIKTNVVDTRVLHTIPGSRRRLFLERRQQHHLRKIACAEESKPVVEAPPLPPLASRGVPPLPILPTLPRTEPINAAARTTRKRMVELPAEPHRRVLKACEGRLNNYFQKCRCRWCLHVASVMPCTWCKKNLVAFNENKFALKEEIPCASIKPVFPCQAVKRGVLDTEPAADIVLGAAAVKPALAPVATAKGPADNRKASSGYGSMEVGAIDDIEDDEDDSPPIFFTAEPKQDNVVKSDVLASTPVNCDTPTNSFESSIEDEDAAFEKIINTYEFIDLSELYLRSKEEVKASLQPTSATSSSTPNTPSASKRATSVSPRNKAGSLGCNSCGRQQQPQQLRNNVSFANLSAQNSSRHQNSSLNNNTINNNNVSNKNSNSLRCCCPSTSSTLTTSRTSPNFLAPPTSSSKEPNRRAFNRSSEDRRKRFLLLGAEGVGKTALATQLAQGGWEPKHVPSFIDFQIKEDFFVEGRILELRKSIIQVTNHSKSLTQK